jgi:hypothetical protein
MAVKKKTNSKSRVSTAKPAQKSGAFKLWMALLLVGIIAVVGIIIVQFSNAGQLSVNAPVTRQKQSDLSGAFNHCANQFQAPTGSHPQPYFVDLPDTSFHGPGHKGGTFNLLNGAVQGDVPNGSSYGDGINACYNYARKFLNIVTNDSGMSGSSSVVNQQFSDDIGTLRITINKLLDIRINKCNSGDQASCQAIQYFRGLGMINGDNHIPWSSPYGGTIGSVDPQLTSWMNFFTYLYLTSTPVN